MTVIKISKKGLVSMLKIKLSNLLGEHKMTQTALADATKIRPATISKIYYEEIKRIEVWQIEAICKEFKCKVEDLFEYVPDHEK
jgi:putative transcriptional regulator